VTEPDWDQIGDDLEDWGYPRDIEPLEWGSSCWFRWGEDVIFWFNVASEPDDELRVALHVGAKPMTLGQLMRLDTARFMGGVETIAELLNAVEIVAILSRDKVGLRRHLEKFGWSENERGWMMKTLGCA
jgi:hypothetical protein